MEKIKKIWDKLSYEAIIFVALMLSLLMTRATELQGWSSAWSAMDYSMGSGSRLLIGSIYRLFYGDFLDYTVAYKYTMAGIALTIAVLSIVLGRMIRMSIAARPDLKHAVFGTVAALDSSGLRFSLLSDGTDYTVP